MTSTVRQWMGAYQAVVARNDDPLGHQRVTLRIPQVFGTAVSQWAAPASAKGPAAPVVGTVVTAMFLGGDVNHPVYLAAVTAPVTSGGTAVLTGATPVVVSNLLVTANSRILLTIQVPGGTPGSPFVSSRSAGVSFSIESTGADDTSTVAYEIFEPA